MNDSLLDELERDDDGESAPYEPLMGRKGSRIKGPNSVPMARNRSTESDVWSELHEEPRDAANLDAFFANLYNYFYHKGLTSIVISGLVNLVNLLFTIVLSTFLLGCVDWEAMAYCDGPTSCGNLTEYVSCSGDWGMYKIMIFFYCFLFSMYWVWMVLKFLQTTKEAIDTRLFYRDRLNINTRELQSMDWNSVVNRYLHLNMNNRKLSALDIASRIMRKENYLIALFNKKVLGLETDLPDFLFCARVGISNLHRNFFTKNMEWNLNFCILDYMFTDNFVIRRKFLTDVEGLRNRFVVAGVVNFFMVPFVLLFMIMHFFLKYTQEWYTQRNYLGPRQWSSYALWQFREFNELQHVFDERIARSYEYAQQFQSLFATPVVSVVARGISFISGSLLAVLFVFSLYKEETFIYVRLFDRPLIWYGTILGVVFTLARSFIPTVPENTDEAEETMLKVVAHTHYIPAHWKGKCHTFNVRDEFYQLFQYKAKLFFLECLSVILTPYILCFCLPQRAESIIDFIQKYSVNIEGLGSVCRYTLFDFKRFGNSQYGCPTNSGDTDPTVDGKMEKSYLNFKEHHPDWKGSAEGDTLLNRLEAFKGEQEVAALEKSLASINLSSHIGNSGFFKRGLHEEQKEGAVEPGSSMFGGDSMSISQQLLHSQVIQAALGNTQHENHFYWLEKYYQAQLERNDKPSTSEASRKEFQDV